MRYSAKKLIWAALLFFTFCAQAAGQTPLTCQLTNGALTPTMRAEGLAERTGDILLLCSGGTPTASGTALPQVNVTVALNTSLTSRVMDATGASEAVLTVDEPGSGYLQGAPSTQLACATPLTGCSIISNGGEPYDGTPGHPNVFEGVVSSNNSVTFYGVPLTAPGSFGISGDRVLRITNIRANTASFWSVASASMPTNSIPAVQATVSIAGSPAVAVSTSSEADAEGFIPAPGALIVGFAQFGLNYQTWNAANTAVTGPVSLSACAAAGFCAVASLRFTENFGTATLPRGGSAPQNIPGTVYNSETGFFDPALASSNPNFATIGLANAATRLKATFQGIPSGAQLWVAVGSSAVLTANEAGPLSQVAATGTIGGTPVAQLPVTNGSATAVWEVIYSNPNEIDTYQFPVWVVFPSGSTPAGTLTIQGSFAPNADNGAFPLTGEGMAQTATYPEPRFTSVEPANLTIGETHGALVQGEASVSFVITVQNTGSATSGEVAVEDLLPSGVLTVTSISGSNWNCVVETLICTRSDSLGQGQSYPPIYLIGHVLTNAPPLFVNYLTVSGGGSNTFTASDTVTVAQNPPALTSISPTQAAANFAPFTLTVNGSSFQSGASILWTLPGGATSTLVTTFVSTTQLQATVPASGVPLGGTAEVAVVNPNYGLSGELPFTLTGSGPGAQQPLSVSSVQNGSFSQGQDGATYTVTLSNQYGALTPIGTVTVTDTVTSGLTLVSMSGPGWACSGNICSRSDSLAGLSSYPPITVTVNVAANASSPQVNSLSISDSASTFSSSYSAPILAALPVSALSVTPSSGAGAAQTFVLQYSDSFGAADLSTVYAWFTTDLNAADTAYSCQASYSRAANELYLENDAGSGTLGPVVVGGGGILANSQCALNVRAASVTSSGTTLTLSLPVTFTTAFPGARSISLYAVGSSASSGWQTLGTWTVSGPQQALTVSSAHSGVFTQGQNGALYTITVSNGGTGPSLGQVTVAENLSAGLSLVSMTGSGWTCSGASCTRSDALAIGASYPSITVAVNVAANAGSPQTNSVTVSGGGSASNMGTDSTVIVPQTTISLVSAPNPSEFGKTATITATVNPSSATGVVTFYDGVTVLGTGVLSSGQATLNTILLASGGRSLHAHYSGDGMHGASNSAAAPQSVLPVSAVTFLPAVSYVSAGNLPALATGDFNGDGKADLAIAGTDFVVRILLGNGDGTFTESGDYGDPVTATSIVVGDFNGDGKIDLAAISSFSRSISVLFGNGDGTFQSPINTDISVPLNQGVAADFNGDGKVDLASAGSSGTGAWVLMGNGDGAFQAPVSYGNANYAHSLAVADFNGDGKPDIVITNSADGSVIVLLGIGDGTFATGVEYAAGGGTGGYLASVTTGDFNGDGKPDIAVATAGLIAVLLGNGDGTFQTALLYSSGLDPAAIIAADFNGDGLLDLAVTDSVAGTVSVFIGNGHGSFAEPPAIYNSGGSTPSSVLAGEFNGDGRTDLAVVNLGVSGNFGTLTGDNISILLASGISGISCSPNSFSLTSFVGGSAISTTCSVTTSPAGATVTASASTTNGGAWLSAQVTGTSGSPLLIFANPGSLAAGIYTGAITLQISGASATVPVTLTIYNLPALSITAIPVGSFTQGQTQAQYSVTVSNPAPGSQTSGVVTVTETVSSGLTLASISGLGWICSGNACARSDALAGGNSYPAILMTVNVAAGATLPQTNSVTVSGGNSAAATFVFTTGVISPATVSLTSLSNPIVFGQAAALTATVTPSAATGRVTFYEGTTILGTSTLSSGAASLSTIMLPAGGGTLKAYYGGDTAHGPNTSNPLSLSVNPRTGGGFVAGQSYTGVSSNSGAAGDFNGDGKPDLAVIEEGGSIAILLGDGQGNLQKVASYLDQNGPWSLAVGDFNGDGKLDLAVAHVAGAGSILLGNGDGTFQPAINFSAACIYQVAVADFNGDGKADLACDTGLLLGNGDGTFQSQVTYPVSVSNPTVGDFNGDGKADLASVVSGGVAVMLGNGDGTFQAPITSAMSTNGLVLAVADFNGDGKTDLAVADTSGNLDILLGYGDGGFHAVGSYFVGGYPYCLTVSDFNGDGKTDVAVCSGDTVNLLPGNGDGTFQSSSVYTVGTYPQSIVVADFNGDGRPDVAAIGEDGTAAISLLLGVAAPDLTISSA